MLLRQFLLVNLVTIDKNQTDSNTTFMWRINLDGIYHSLPVIR